MLWCDKYRPAELDKVVVQAEIAKNLKNLVAGGDCPHILLYGPNGAGKKTLIVGILRELYGPAAEKLKVENKIWKTDVQGGSSVEVEMTSVGSNYHIEMTPADAGFKDRHVVSAIVKEMARNKPIETHAGRGFKVIVLHEVSRLSKLAQQSLRRTMEKYSKSCRIILCCDNVSRVIEAVRSRCVRVRVPAPSMDQIVSALQEVAKKEGLKLPNDLAVRIGNYSQRNLRKAMLTLEACRVEQYPFDSKQTLVKTDWEEYITQICSDIVGEQSPKQLFKIRGKLYELLGNCIPPDVIFRVLTQELLRKIDSDLKQEVVLLAAQFEHRLQLGSENKAIFHIEAFVANVMRAYKKFIVSAFHE